MINNYLWAKKQDKSGIDERLPLYQHLEDSKEVIGLLWEHRLSDSQRDLIINSLSVKDHDVAKNLVKFSAAIHDLGKVTPAFQTKKGFQNSLDLDLALIEKLERNGFSNISDLKLSNPEKSHHSIASHSILKRHGFKDDITTIVGSHHGKPIDSLQYIEDQKSYEKNYFACANKDDDTYKKWNYEQENIINWALKSCEFESIEDLPEISQPGQVIITGLLIMADRIASNEKYFPLISLDDNEIHDLDNRIENGFFERLKTEAWQSNDIDDVNEFYEHRFGFLPKETQKVFSEIVQNTKDPGIFILEAPMGIGKTEAALTAAEILAYKKGSSGIFFALPTQATSNGIFPRIESRLQSVDEDFGENVGIRLIHGKAHLNEEFNGLARNIDQDEGGKPSVIVNERFSGKKSAILDDFVVGTIDQLLLMALKQKHLFLRHLGFSKKVVIIDEVHAYDAYMSQYLYQALRWLGAYDVPVIILSATLPSEKREELVKIYLQGKKLNGTNVKVRDIDMSEEVEKDAYPLITYNDGLSIKYKSDFSLDDTKKVQVIKESSDNLFDLLKNLYEKGGNIGVIVNTVKNAQDIAKKSSEMFGEENVELLHSRFIDTDRIKKEKELLEKIGKGAKRPDTKIYVGTQVIEQSLDIDFDVLITEIAPMDLILQRIGRLHRHDIKRLKAYEKPIVYVLDSNEDFEFPKGSSAVYGNYLLARTTYYMPKFIEIPQDISKLVQKVYSEDDLNLEDNLKEKYLEFKKEHENLIERKESQAKAYRIDIPKYKVRRNESNSIIGWLNNSANDFTEEKSYAQVRDTKETIEVIALKKNSEGYGFFDEDKDISQLVFENNTAKEIAGHTLKLPTTLSESYNIDKTISELESYNLNNLAKRQDISWLKGSLGIIFDENNEFELNGFILKYDPKYGLIYEKKDKEEVID